MPCVILQDEQGNKRVVPSHEPYTPNPGERVVGSSPGCDTRIETTLPLAQACVKLQDLHGNIRLVPAGKSYVLNPGEKVIGSDKTCGGTIQLVHPNKPDLGKLRNELDAAIGSGAGDWIKMLARPLAKLVGKEGCSMCEARRIATNAYGQLKEKHGQLEAIRIIKDLWAMSYKVSGDEVLAELKKHLAK
jgi:hypothetical protein